MKRSDYGKLVRLTKRYLEEEKIFGEPEIVLDAVPAKPRPAAVPSPVKTVHAPRLRPAPAASPVPAAPPQTLDDFRKKVAGCTKCPLGTTRHTLVFGAGNEKAAVMFIGEGPGCDEDQQGEPFVGEAGQLLTRIIESIGLTRESVYITTLVKCHPMVDPSDPKKYGNERPPAPEEIAACLPYLETQITLIRPRVLCTLGTWASRTLLRTEEPIGKLRGKFHDCNGTKLLPTYHPAALLRNAALKKDVWEDMKMLKKELAGKQ